jgi:hypothetical protein
VPFREGDAHWAVHLTVNVQLVVNGDTILGDSLSRDVIFEMQAAQHLIQPRRVNLPTHYCDEQLETASFPVAVG